MTRHSVHGPPVPASGTFRWLQKPDECGRGGVIRINDTPYLLAPIRADKNINRNRPIIGWRMVRLAGFDTKAYDVRPGEEGWECDCPDFTINRDKADTPEARECKHCRALKKALATLGEEGGEHAPT